MANPFLIDFAPFEKPSLIVLNLPLIPEVSDPNCSKAFTTSITESFKLLTLTAVSTASLENPARLNALPSLFGSTLFNVSKYSLIEVPFFVAFVRPYANSDTSVPALDDFNSL